MYRLLLYYLIALILAAMALSALGNLHYNAVAIGVSAIILTISCVVVNKVFAAIFQAPTNVESAYITALILALIITPLSSYTKDNLSFLLAAASLAMASKYILTINKKHLFNPAAIAVVLTALGPRQSASWWVGTSALIPVVVIGGLLLIRKIRRERMVIIFLAAALAATAIYSLMGDVSVGSNLAKTITTSAMLFLGFVMLTEPLTSPATTNKQTWYALLAGCLFPPEFHIFKLYSTPELALSAANIFSYLISPKVKLFPRLVQKLRLTPDSLSFIFKLDQKLKYQPGQYMEWTLQHEATDNRGARRYFTLASSPTENNIQLGVKFYNKSSSYKQALFKMDAQSIIAADVLGGDFVMPKDQSQKLVFIAGGIGITPYRSMIKYLIDTNQKRDITIFYSAKTGEDFAYKEVFEEARAKLGINTIYCITGQDQAINNQYAHHGRISQALIKHQLPDYHQRTFYISGTQSMVQAMQHSLKGLGLPRRQIKVDYFSGYS